MFEIFHEYKKPKYTKKQTDELARAVMKHGLNTTLVVNSVKSLSRQQIRSFIHYNKNKQERENQIQDRLGDCCCWCGIKLSTSLKLENDHVHEANKKMEMSSHTVSHKSFFEEIKKIRR